VIKNPWSSRDLTKQLSLYIDLWRCVLISSTTKYIHRIMAELSRGRAIALIICAGIRKFFLKLPPGYSLYVRRSTKNKTWSFYDTLTFKVFLTGNQYSLQFLCLDRAAWSEGQLCMDWRVQDLLDSFQWFYFMLNLLKLRGLNNNGRVIQRSGDSPHNLCRNP